MINFSTLQRSNPFIDQILFVLNTLHYSWIRIIQNWKNPLHHVVDTFTNGFCTVIRIDVLLSSTKEFLFDSTLWTAHNLSSPKGLPHFSNGFQLDRACSYSLQSILNFWLLFLIFYKLVNWRLTSSPSLIKHGHHLLNSTAYWKVLWIYFLDWKRFYRRECSVKASKSSVFQSTCCTDDEVLVEQYSQEWFGRNAIFYACDFKMSEAAG